MALDFSQKRSLQIIDPDGNEITISPVHIAIKDSSSYNQKLKDLDKAKDSKELEDDEYIFAVLSLMVKDFKKGQFENFSIPELTQIMEELPSVIRGKRTEEEKKNQ